MNGFPAPLPRQLEDACFEPIPNDEPPTEVDSEIMAVVQQTLRDWRNLHPNKPPFIVFEDEHEFILSDGTSVRKES